MDIIDLRSDTVTWPTPAMRKAMAEAPVGDDVLGEDPTVNKLQDLAALKMGKEAGLFVASGTMGNLLAVLAHCGRGDEAIMGTLGHTFLFEAGGVSALGGVMVHTVPNQPDGTLALADLAGALRANDVHQPISKLIILENTQNRCGGVPLTAEYTRQVAEFACAHEMALHLDGARIFNAAAALGVPAAVLTAPVDSVTFCLSKALCAPVGSVLCGSAEFIAKAKRLRKMVGGGMRQAGILAAAGIIGIEEMVEKLPEDHRRARALASGLQEIPGLILETPVPASNMVFMALSDEVHFSARQVAEKMAKRGVMVGVVGERRFRVVTHHWITDAGVNQTIEAFRAVLQG